ncbi:hypothetical protein OIU85_008084, partial [Salix viminalis]
QFEVEWLEKLLKLHGVRSAFDVAFIQNWNREEFNVSGKTRKEKGFGSWSKIEQSCKSSSAYLKKKKKKKKYWAWLDLLLLYSTLTTRFVSSRFV